MKKENKFHKKSSLRLDEKGKYDAALSLKVNEEIENGLVTEYRKAEHLLNELLEFYSNKIFHEF